MTTEIFVRRNGFAKREKISAYQYGKLAAHRAQHNEQFWVVTHPESGSSVTEGRLFDSRAQAKRYAEELQRHLDFDLLKDEGDAWGVQRVFGSENIHRAMSAALQAAFGA